MGRQSNFTNGGHGRLTEGAPRNPLSLEMTIIQAIKFTRRTAKPGDFVAHIQQQRKRSGRNLKDSV